jgi:2-oxoisovalerate dehydrogenase E2 component (dihydrolipoyl transacylase)
MGRYVFKLPDVGEGTAEAEIVAWHVAVGDHIKEDQQLVDVMTDKATVEMTSPVDGVIVSLHGEPGEMAPVGAPLVEFEVEGTAPVQPEPKSSVNGSSAESPRAKATKTKEKPSAAPAKVAPVDVPKPVLAADSSVRVAAIATRTPSDKPLASPAVRQRAHDLGIELQFVVGSGAAGRISHEDLDHYIATRGQSPAGAHRHQPRDGVEEVKVIGLRRRIAERMQNSKRRIPHFAYVEEVDMTELEELRAYLNANKRPDQPKLNVLPFLMCALVRVLPEFPQINARFDDEAGIVQRIASVHIGIATQTANGLLVPVVRHAEARDLWEAASEVARVAALTRDNKASKEDLTGSTITITSLGTLGGVVTTPVINYPEVAIIGPNAILEKPVVRNGQIVVRKMMNLSSSFDHRVVDGYDAAQFIQRMKQMLEHPATLFMD